MESTGLGRQKTPLATSHGDSLADQSFQSFKSKEIRDCESPPHELGFTQRNIADPNTSGWNVVTSTEVSPDGRNYKTESLATTEGTQKLPDGHSKFAGINEQMQKRSHQGDDKNYVKTAAESSKTQLQEQTVTGDENNGRVEQKSSVVASSSQTSTSKYSSSGTYPGTDPALDHRKVLSEFDQMVDSAIQEDNTTEKQQLLSEQRKTSSTKTSEKWRSQKHFEEQQEHQQKHEQSHYKQQQNDRFVVQDNVNEERQRTDQKRTNKTNRSEQVTRKLIQEEVDQLSAAPGKIISRSVEYPDPNTKVITETKTLPDGTTVTTRKYETKSSKSQSWSSSSNQRMSSTSRTTVDDHARVQRVEYSQDHVDDKQQPKNVQPRRVRDRGDEEIYRNVRKNEVNEQEQATVVQREAQSRHKTDVSNATTDTTREFREQNTDAENRSVTNKTENLKDQVETFTVDSSHKTVKKDLNQAIHSQDFIENEKGCTMVDHSQRAPQKYQTQPRAETSSSQTHTSSKKHEHQSERIESSHELIQEECSKATTKSVQDFSTQGFPSVKSQRPDESVRPDKDTTTKGFPSIKSTKEESYRRESNDFSTQDFHSKKTQKHQEDITVRNDDRSTRYVENQQRIPRSSDKNDKHHPLNVPKNFKPDMKDSVSNKHETSTEHVKQSSVRDQQETKTIEQKTVVRQSEDFTTHGFPSVRSDPSGPTKISGRPKPRNTVEDLQQQTETKQISKEQQIVTSVRNDKTLSTQAASDESSKYRETHPVDNSRPADSRYPSKYRDDNDETTKTVHETQRKASARAQDVKIQYTSPGKPEVIDTSAPRGNLREPEQVKPQQAYYRDDERPEQARPSGKPHEPYESHKSAQPDNDFNDASSVTTERTDISEISNRNRNELTTTRISVEVDAAHEAFVRSLRCVSPVDQNRGSIRSIRTSTNSVRSSSSPDKPSRRSPSRDSDVSRISSSTVTRAKDQTDVTRRTGPITKQTTTTPERSRPKEGTPKKDMPTLRKATESADLIKSTTEKEDSRKRTTKQVTESIHQVEDERGGKQTKTIKKSTPNMKQPLSRIPTECVDSSKRTPDKVAPNTRYSVTKPQTPATLSNTSSKYTIAQNRTNITTENKQDQQKKHHSITKPYTIHGSVPKEYPFGYVPRKQTFDSPDRTYPVVPKASKLSNSNYEDNKRHDRGTQPNKGTDLYSKPTGKSPSHQPEPNDDTARSYKKSTIRNASDTDHRSTVTTNRTSKLPKQIRDESPVGQHDDRPRKLKPSEEEKSPSAAFSSPTYIKRPYPEQTTDLDLTDITIEVNLKQVGQNVDMTTSSNTTIPRKTYVNEKFIENEKEDIEINRRSQIDNTTTLEFQVDETKYEKERQYRDDSTNSEIKETYYPNETGEPFYLIPTQPQDNDGNKPTEPIKKTKPPLNRSETYEERCRQILGINQSNTTTTDNLTTLERNSKEKDYPYNHTPLTVSAAPRKTSETNGSDYPKTIDILSTREDTQTESSIYGTRKISKTPSREQSPNKEPTGDTPLGTKEFCTPTSSPFSSLSRKTASKYAPSQPSNIRPSITSFKDDQPQKKAPLPRPRSESPSKRPSAHKSIEKSETNQDYPREDDSLPSYEYSTLKSSGTPSRSPTRPATAIQIDQRSVKHTTAIEDTKRSSTTSDHSTETSPLRKPYTTEVRYEISNRKISKDSHRQSSPSARSPTAPHHSRSPTRKASSREVQNTNVKTIREKIVKDTKTIKEKSPQRSPIRECSKGSTPTTSPTRKPQATPRTSPHSPSRTSEFGVTKNTIRTTTKDSLDVDKKFKSTKLRTTEIIRSPEKGTITTRKTPSEVGPITRKSGTSPNRRSPLKIEPGREQKLRKEIDEDNYEISRKTITEYTSKTVRSEDERKSNHITTARIQLSPTPTRKLSNPESTRESPVKPVKSTRSISTPAPRQVPKPQKPLSPIRHSKTPGEIIITNDSRTSSRTVITRKTPAKKVPVIERKKSAPVYSTVRETSQKFSRSASDNLMKTTIAKRVKPDIETTLVGSTQKLTRKSSTGKVPGKPDRRPSKHLATKTINLTTPNNLINREEMDNIIIDIQQAKSSREPSPNKIIPTPVPDDVDTGKTRYPDTVQEPDEEPRRKPKIKNIPIFEEGTNDYIGCHITEVDESFEEDEQLTNVDRTSRTTTTYKNYDKVSEEGVEDDECLLSVHDKVTKFINTAEEIKKPRTSTPFTREVPQENFPEEDDCLLSVNAKVSKFLTTAESITKPFKSGTAKPMEGDVVHEIDDELKEDECLLRVSEKVDKFVSTAEKLVASSPQRSPELVGKINRQFSRESEDIEPKPTTKSTGRPAVVERYAPRSSKPNEKPLSAKPVLKSSEAIRKAKQVFESGATTKQKDVLYRPSVWEGRKKETDVRLQDIGVYTTTRTETHTEVDSVKYPKNTDDKKSSGVTTNSISSRKNLYETNISTSKVDSSQVSNLNSKNHSVKRTTDEKPRSRAIPQQQESPRSPVRSTDKIFGKRPSLEKSDIHVEKTSHRTTSKHSTETSTTRDKHDHKDEISQSRAPKDSVSAKRNIFESSEHDSHIVTSTSTRNPSYMDHTVSSLEHIRRDSAETSRSHSRKPSLDSNFAHETDGTTRSGKKFGVELKRVDSKHDNKVRRKSSSSEVPHIEEIFDLELLEQMLQTVVGYEQRRRIRSQIRVVKKLIETQTKDLAHVEILKYVKHERSPSRRSTPSPTRFQSTTTTDTSARSTQYTERQSEHISRNFTKQRSLSPRFDEEKVTHVRTEKTNTSRSVKDDKPFWVTSNVLRRSSGNEENGKVATTKKTATTKTSSTRTQVQKHTVMSDEDCITSSYGIGPTDDDGKPLFGIRALKKKSQPSETKKVTGTIITETFYSENGGQPVGERKVTTYSTNPEDIDKLDCRSHETKNRERFTKDGITSVTRSEKMSKYGNTDGQEIQSSLDNKPRTATPRPGRMVRKGSVKEISEKLIRKKSISEMPEKSLTSAYPKAGLILRAHTHTNRTNTGGSSIPSDTVEYDSDEEVSITRQFSAIDNEGDLPSENTSKNVTTSTRSFLNTSGTKIKNVTDILDRMRNADNVVEDGDTTEDTEARALLNKFLGATILLSGMEKMVPKEAASVLDAPIEAKQEVKTTTRVTKTITKKDSSTSVLSQRTTDIENIWDEDILKGLLEKSTNYEDRRKIRSRIGSLMAERQACADVVASVETELRKKQDAKVNTDNKNTNVVETESDKKTGTRFNETESDEESGSSEYEEVEEIVEEIEEEEEVEEEEEEEHVEEEEEGEEKKKVIEEECEKNDEVKKTEENKCKETPVVMKSNSSNSKNQEKIIPVKEESSKTTSQTQELCATETSEIQMKNEGALVTSTSKVTAKTVAAPPKQISPFAKFKQLDKQNSLQSPSTPRAPGGPNRGAPIFKFTDASLNTRAATAKEQLLQWCQMKTKEYENVQIVNFSASWTDGLAFCALIHHFLPNAFDYSKLTPQQRRHNFELAFRVADEEAGIAPLLDVEDMVVMKRPDWKCVFTYVQSIYRRFRNSE